MAENASHIDSFGELASKKSLEVATLAGGCFWGMEDLLRQMPGVIDTQVGYTGGFVDKATYQDVKTGKSGHAEAVEILFDPKKISYEEILLQFFRIHDPTTLERQGNDIGSQYRSAIFYRTTKQKETAEAVILRVNKSKKWPKPVVTQVVAFNRFWRAEEYHQKYLKKDPQGYTCHYVRKIDF